MTFTLAVLTIIVSMLSRIDTCPAADNLSEPDRPIIAGIRAHPETYVGRHVEVYGLVVSVEPNGERFLLQDVSQVPFLVISPRWRVETNYQLIVAGVVQYVDGRLGIIADGIKPARVLAGGGCC